MEKVGGVKLEHLEGWGSAPCNFNLSSGNCRMMGDKVFSGKWDSLASEINKYGKEAVTKTHAAACQNVTS